MAPQPTTEPVRVRRGRPAAVVVAAIAVLLLLVAKPWDEPPTALPLTSAVAGPAAPSPSAATTHAATGSPTPAVIPLSLPTPDIAPIGPAGEFELSAPPDSALARCTYTRARGGVRYLRSIEVQPPKVMLDPRARTSDINRIGWRFELEVNRVEDVLDRAWRTVERSRGQIVASAHGRPAAFTPVTLRYSAVEIDKTAVFRARVIIEWYTRNFELAGRAEVVASSYQEGRDESSGSWPAFCRGARPAR